MSEIVATTTPDNTQVASPTSADVKPPEGSALTGVETKPDAGAAAVTQTPEQIKAQVDADAAAAKAEADAGKTPEQIKADDEKAAADKVKADAEAAKNAPPADGVYKFDFEGSDKLDPELTTKFMGIAKDAKLSTAAANELAKLGPVLVAKQTEALSKQWQETRAGWVTAQKSDKELGGENYVKSLEVGNRGVAALLKVAPELKNAIEMGLLDHPGIWKAMIHHGKILKEGKTIDGGPMNSSEVDIAKKLYPNHA